VNPLRLCLVGPAHSVSVRRWAEWFAVHGHEVTVITVEPDDSPMRYGVRQIDVGVLLRPKKLGRLLSVVRMVLAIGRVKPDVLHVHYVRGLAWGLLASRMPPCVMTPWGSDVLEDQGAFKEPYSRWLTLALLKRAQLVTAHSAYMEAQVRPLLRPDQRLVRISWGVDLTRFRPGVDIRALRRQWGISGDQRVIFSPRLAQPFYNHDRVLRALPAVCEKVPKALLVMRDHFSDPGYVEGLRRLASELGVTDRVKFLGSIPYHEMPGWFNLAEAVVMVPRSDGMPSTLLEAMACGTVPVLNRLPQYAELVQHGVNGFLVDPEQGDLAGALVGALSDPVMRREMAQRNRAIVTEGADQDREMSRMQSEYRLLAGT